MVARNASFTLHHIFNLMLFLPLISSISRCFSTDRIYSEPDPCWLALLDRYMWLFRAKSTQKYVFLCSSHVLHPFQGRGPDPGWFSKGSAFLKIKRPKVFLARGVNQHPAISHSSCVGLDQDSQCPKRHREGQRNWWHLPGSEERRKRGIQQLPPLQGSHPVSEELCHIRSFLLSRQHKGNVGGECSWLRVKPNGFNLNQWTWGDLCSSCWFFYPNICCVCTINLCLKVCFKLTKVGMGCVRRRARGWGPSLASGGVATL